MLSHIVDACQFLLFNYPAAQECRDYLDTRLFSSSQKKWGFGYFPTSEHLPALFDLVGKQTLLDHDLIYKTEINDAHSSRTIYTSKLNDHSLIMPYRDTYGRAVALIGRSLLNDQERSDQHIGKYKNSSTSEIFQKGNLLFGLDQHKQNILEKGWVYIVEGQFDVIKAHEIGCYNIVGLGNAGMTDYQYSLITRYSNRLFFLLDNDEAGQKGRKRIINKFGQLATIQDFFVPAPYKDIDEYITKGEISSCADLSLVVKD